MSWTKEIQVLANKIGNKNEPYIIAEMACAHNGSIEEAKQLITAAAKAKADAIQLQFFVADETVTPNHEAYKVVKGIEFSFQEWEELVVYARQFEIAVFACTYDVPSVELAVKTKCDGIKLNSADLSNPDVLEAVGRSGIPFTLGTGASTKQEIQKGLDTLYASGARNAVLMHGVQNFPTATEDLHINRLKWLQQEFSGFLVGYADHTEGEDPFAQVVDLLAVANGANVLEKHITLDRSQKGIDYQAALEPDEFIDYVKRMKRGYVALGSNEERPFSPSDLKYRKFQKKSIVANADLKEGAVIRREDVRFIRNETPGLSPLEYDKIEGKRLTTDIKKFENIIEDQLND